MYETLNGLTISGGSFKGIGALGVLFYLEEKGYLKNINYYSGTSIGALIIILIACEIPVFNIFAYIYSESTLVEIFNKPDIGDLFNRISKNMGILHIYETFTYKMEEFMLKEKKWKKLPTLIELYNTTKKELYLVSTRETSNGFFEKVVVSHKTFPNISILRAAEMSANLPWMFCKIKEGDSYYIDGGFSDDFPYKFLKEQIPDPQIFGIFIQETAPLTRTDNPFSFTYRLVSYPISQLSSKQIEELSEKEKKNIIKLKINVLNPVNFNLSQRTRMDYFVEGYQQTEKMFI